MKVHTPSHTLSELKHTYSSALYSYFRVLNLPEACQQFLADPANVPHFTYAPTVTKEITEERYHELTDTLRHTDSGDEAVQAFLQWRLAETKLLQLFLKAYHHPDTVPLEVVEQYRLGQVELYGPLDEKLFGGIITHLRDLAVKDGSVAAGHVMSEITQRLGGVLLDELYIPDRATFKHYQHMFRQAFPKLYAVIDTIHDNEPYDSEEIKAVFERALAAIGAKGWTVRLTDGGANIAVSKYRKQVIISRHLNPRTAHRLKQIVAHEVGCHVQGALSEGEGPRRAGFDENDEGLAIALEQLFAKRFMYKRAMRYLAVCLGYGVDGIRRNFREVHEIVWRAMVILGNDEASARERAFYETVRVFRGGIPAVSGMVYIKDKIYLEGNLLAWRQLENRLLTPEEFSRLFRSHDTIWARDIVP